MSPEVAKFIAPKKTYFGSGATSRIGEAIKWFKAKRIFVVTDRGIRKAGLASILLREIEATRSTAEVFDETRPEPTVDTVEAAAKELTRMGGADLIVSLGGGSVIDVAKCANVVASNGGSILDYEDGIEHPRRVGRVLPSVAIPTTAGTGSEATIWAVFIDPSRKYKTAIQDERLVADFAILDTEMTKTMPAAVTAATGMDALTHAIESYVSRYANPLTDALCVQAIALVVQSLGKAVRNGKDTAARANMLLASYMAGSAFNNSSLGIVHTMAEALGGFYGIPHGVTNALMLPHVMRFNAGATPARYADIAKLMGEDVSGMNRREAAERAATSVEELRRRTGLPDRLRAVGVKKKDFPALLDIADRWANLSGNPRNVTRRHLQSLYEKAY